MLLQRTSALLTSTSFVAFQMAERPPLHKQETFSYLSYYQSALADVGTFEPPPIAESSTSSSKLGTSKELSIRTSSSSDSDYSSPDTTNLPSTTQARRRPNSGVSRASNDRRRLAIVETRNASNGNTRPSEKSRSKRHMHDTSHKSKSSFSLVAPPDASPSAYQDLTPPSTASNRHRELTEGGRKHNRNATHHAGGSDTEFRQEVARRNSQSAMPKITFSESEKPASTPTPPPSSSKSYFLDVRRNHTANPLSTPAIGESKSAHDPVAAPVVTHVPIGMLDRGSPANSPPMSSPSSSSSYSPASSPAYSPKWPEDSSRHRPGILSVTGSLPGLPGSSNGSSRHSSSPKPSVTLVHSASPSSSNRDLENLHLPPSVEARLRRHLASDAGSVGDGEEEIADLPSFPRSSHAREGAFPPSRIVTKSSSSDPDVTVTGLPTQQIGSRSADALIPGLPTAQDVRYNSAVAELPSSQFHQSPSYIQRGISADASLNSLSSAGTLPLAGPSSEYSKPPKDGLFPIKDGLNLPLRRTGSRVSMGSNAHSEGGHSAHYSVQSHSPSRRTTEIASSVFSPSRSNFPSPTKDYGGLSLQSSSPSTVSHTMYSPVQARKSLPSRVKIKSTSPDAMFFSDLLSKRSAHERTLGYAKKINELYMCDCGLTEWIQNVKTPASVPQNAAHHFVPQPRHTSRSSAMSEVSFPRRPDSSVATDLSRVPSPPESTQSLPATLPYPSLAQHKSSGSVRAPVSSIGSNRGLAPISPATTKPTGFFASLGRRTSTRKGGKAGTLSAVSVGTLGPSPLSSPAAAPPRVLTKLSPTSTPKFISKPMPSLPPERGPGGPRAIPNRVARSQTLIVSSPFSSNSGDTMSVKSESGAAVARRPSMFVSSSGSGGGGGGSGGGGGGVTTVPEHMLRDPEFNRQVDKLADLLPQAERRVLAGYLYRSGQDIAAIGQYLEDEQKGRIRR